MTAPGSRRAVVNVWIASAALAVLLVTLAVVAVVTQPALDDRNCNRKKPIAETVAIVLDRTDHVTPGQRAIIVQEVLRACDALPPNSLVCVFGIQDAAGGVLARGFCKCRPEDGTHTNMLVGNPELVREQFKTEFVAPLNEHLTSVWPDSASPNSPIMEALRALAATPEFSDASRPRRIMLFSDMLQNTPALSLYSGIPPWSAFKQAALGALLCNLSGCRVDVFELERPRDASWQDNELEGWWMTYLENCNVPHTMRRYHGVPAASL